MINDTASQYAAADLEAAVTDVRNLTADTTEPFTLPADHLTRLLRYNGAATTGEVPMRTIRLAAAEALEVVATSEVLVSKVIRTAAGVSTDGAKVSTELRARASAIRAQVEAQDIADITAAADALDGGFDVYGYGSY